MQKFFKPLKVKKTCIDLRSIGAREQIEQAVYKMRTEEIRFRNEDEATANLPEPPQPNDWYPETRPRFSLWKTLLSGALSMRP